MTSEDIIEMLKEIYLAASIDNVRNAYEDTSFKLKEVDVDGTILKKIVPVYPLEEERSRNQLMFRRADEGRVTEQTKLYCFTNRGGSYSVKTIKELLGAK